MSIHRPKHRIPCPHRRFKEARQPARVLAVAIEQARDSIIVTTSDLDRPGPSIIYANPSFTTMTGYSLQEIIGKTPRILQGPKTDPAVLRRLREQLTRGEPFFGETVNYRKDGSEFIMEWSVTPVRDKTGTIREFVAVQRDVTARHQAEVAARFLARANRALAESIDYDTTLKTIAHLPVPELADACAVFILSNESTPDTFLLVQRSSASTKAAEAAIRLPDQIGPLARTASTAIAAALRNGQTVPLHSLPPELVSPTTSELSRHTRTSQLTPTLLLPMTVRRRPIGLILFVRTDANQTYSEGDIALAADLASRSALAIDNALAYRQVKQAVAMRDSMLAIVSHDLKSPLAVISGYAQSLLRFLARNTPLDRDRVIDGLEGINRSVMKSVALIDELLDAARMQAGQPLPLNLQSVNLVDLVQREVSDRVVASPETAISFETSTPSLIGQWDRARLTRVIENLLSNAIKYNRPGMPIEVRVDRQDTPDRTRACLTVTDHGIGIPISDLPHIFEAFQRASNVIGRYPGSGIGLAGSKYIVESMGGTIQVQSVEGKGSTFIVCLPLQED